MNPIVGRPESDVIVDTPGPDIIEGPGGDDVLDGAGDDIGDDDTLIVAVATGTTSSPAGRATTG